MFHPLHFRKTAKELGMDAGLYEREYNHFLAKLKKFHESKGSPFRRLPWLGGQFLDLYLLYKKVTSFGGWIKVTEDKRWRDIAEVFNLPSTCTNAAFALRQHYSRYLETFERINFFGEDAEDVMSGSRPHTPVSALPITSPSEYVSPSPVDITRNFEKLVLSLQCGLPNEVDFGINICMLLSNVNNSVFNLTKVMEK
ncbi:AT-rich interactive domain-containing protein 2-like [Exaiptasia diaphana]|uniref:ARID domain-containing protein n=1 Tax=Exaiptasia diaphana TaxID=2652724 RepID=A0A913XB61_EXADI|nr:AT-rich interactive domain-containing protein 2-like [Exaiptasia diaphana]